MHLIKPCPRCGKRLRFPIDRGIIRVTCPCGHSFTADPDDTGVYHNASFDLSRPHAKSRIGHFTSSLRGLNLQALSRQIITRFIEFTYRIRNYPLLPSAEKWKLILTLFLAASLLAAMIVAFYALMARPARPDPMVI